MPVGVNGEMVATGVIDMSGATIVGAPTNGGALTAPPLRFLAFNSRPLGGLDQAAASAKVIDSVAWNPDGLGLSGGAVSLTEGSWLVEADVTIRGISGSSRASWDCWLTADGIQARGTVGIIYVRQGDFGGTASVSAVVTVPAAQSVAVGVEVSRTEGNVTGELVAGGTRLRASLLN